jgi:hypothetical protein
MVVNMFLKAEGKDGHGAAISHFDGVFLCRGRSS